VIKTSAYVLGLVAMAVASTVALGDDSISFQGKTLTMIIASPAGGGTDTSGRLIAPLLAGQLPGKPRLIVRNIPGAEGVIGMNYFAKQAAPDGLTMAMGSTTQADPLLYRKPQSQFDPTTFPIVGGIGRGGTVLLIRKEAERRLYDTIAPPVIIGALGGVPRSGMQTMAWGIEYLGWNARWVVGYRGTNDLIVALERGEIDITSTGNMFQIQKLLSTGKFKIVSQSGTLQNGKTVARPEFGSAPLFSNLLNGKITDPIAQKAFDYWASITSLDKWIALPPNTSTAVLDTYRAAYATSVADPDFIKHGNKISEDFEPMTFADVELLIGKIGASPPEAIAHIGAMLRRQGIAVE
jgi:hypothetical protein